MPDKNGESRPRRGSTRFLEAKGGMARAAHSDPAKAGGEVQDNHDRQRPSGLPNTSEGDAVQLRAESHAIHGRASSDPPERGAVQETDESHCTCGRPAFDSDILALQEAQIRRKFCIGKVNALINKDKALVRRYCGFDSNREQDEADSEKINASAARIVERVIARKPLSGEEAEIAAKVFVDLEISAEMLAPVITRRTVVEKEMRRIATTLPVYPWAKQVRGLGDLGLAVIVAEAGDLSRYPHVRMLWKRLGLAPYDGHAYSHWRTKGGLKNDEWTAAGYAPRRRAEIHACVGEPLLKVQGKDGPYRAVYDERRAQTAIAHPDWTPGHSHGDAMRIMTKVLIADLWSAWRGSSLTLEARHAVARADSTLPDRPQESAKKAKPRRGSAPPMKAKSGMARADSVSEVLQ